MVDHSEDEKYGIFKRSYQLVNVVITISISHETEGKKRIRWRKERSVIC
jgi:hypothetical protein